VLIVFCFVEEIMKILSKLMFVGALACATVAPSSAWNGSFTNDDIKYLATNFMDNNAGDLNAHIQTQLGNIADVSAVSPEGEVLFRDKYRRAINELLLKIFANYWIGQNLHGIAYDQAEKIERKFRSAITAAVGEIHIATLRELTAVMEAAFVEFIDNHLADINADLKNMRRTVIDRMLNDTDSESEYESESE
jgi:hypothetical protein